MRNKYSIVTKASFSNHYKTKEEVKYRKNLFGKGYIDELNYRNLPIYFTEEVKFFSKLLDEKRNLEKIRKFLIYNNEKENKLEVKGDIKILKYMIKKRTPGDMFNRVDKMF